MKAKLILPSLAAFLLGLFLTWHFGWTATDLVWSLWLSSLVFGYATICITIFGLLFFVCLATQHPSFPKSKTSIVLSFSIVAAVFMLSFFSLHYCAFHAIHAFFLMEFFPLLSVADPAQFSAAFLNPPLLWKLAIVEVFPKYGLFLLPIFVAEHDRVYAGYKNAKRLYLRARDKNMDASSFDRSASSDSPRENKTKNDLFAAPYKNVIRIHMFIIVFAILEQFNLNSFFVFVFAYVMLFAPWALIAPSQEKSLN